MASKCFTINSKCHQYAHGFMFMKLILEAHKAKINCSIGCNQDLAEGDFRKDSHGNFAQK